MYINNFKTALDFVLSFREDHILPFFFRRLNIVLQKLDQFGFDPLRPTYYGFPEHRTPPLSRTVTGCHNCISNPVRLPVSDFLPIHTSTTTTMHNLCKALVILLVAVKKY